MITQISKIKTLGLALGMAAMVSADPIHFLYNGSNYGVMNMTYLNSSTIQVSMAAAATGSIAGTTDFQITGFAFNFNNSALASGIAGLSVSSPAAGDFAGDYDGMDWQLYTGNFPQLTNATHTTFEFGLDEDTKKNLNTPGIHMGYMDVLNISGFTGLTAGTDLHKVVELQGIRIQAIKYVNGGGEGSLFLGGTVIHPPRPPVEAVPEPATVALMGLGLLGLAYGARRRK